MAAGSNVNPKYRRNVVTANGGQVVEQRRKLFNRVACRRYQGAEDVVDPIEIVVEILEGPSAECFAGHHAKVQVDVSVDGQQQILQNQQPPGSRSVESECSHLACRLVGTK